MALAVTVATTARAQHAELNLTGAYTAPVGGLSTLTLAMMFKGGTDVDFGFGAGMVAGNSEYFLAGAAFAAILRATFGLV